MTKNIFLTEIGIEELPAKILHDIACAFYQNIIHELHEYNILYEKAEWFATPRRLSIKIKNIDVSEKITLINKRGPSVYKSFDKNGFPTQAARRWAENCNININQAHRLKNEKGEWLIYQIKKKQKSTTLLLPDIIEKSLKNVSITHTMRWKDNISKFCRPIRNIVLLLDDKILPGKIYGLNSSNYIYNHICDKEKKIRIQNAKQYPAILFNTYNIIANYQERKKFIQKNIQKIACTVNGLIKINTLLINEVTSLVESPTIFLGSFQKKFLTIPTKILVYTIEYYQKCFPVYNIQKKIMPYFVLVSNTYSQTSSNIVSGNEKVMHARLEDTEFFFKKDKKTKLIEYLNLLKKVIFQNNLGTLYDKTIRLQLLVQWISPYNKANINDSFRAATLSKCDLLTNMVSEFKELKGTIGMYYALENGEKKDIALAIKEQYLPSFSGDNLPLTNIGCSLSIADKIDTLSGMFIIKKIPTSDKDPYGLRRLAIGIIRIIIHNKIPLDLKNLIHHSVKLYEKKNHYMTIYDDILNFFMIRLFNWYQEKGYSIQVIKSVLSYKLTIPIDVHNRIQAIDYFKKLNSSKNILLSMKRISNILEKNNENITDNINISIFQEKTEKILFEKIINYSEHFQHLAKSYKYQEILLKVCELELYIHNFLDTIKILHSDYKIRINRLNLLNLIKNMCFKIANFTYLY
ncbi:glycine--tRNA ligase subunit beta [Buchnera aphidicola]|uniref:glycine--tRNA ligase subunit beta n=1 Tax=Buchnera aphidicola TaxID=9 RepID=UPI0034639EC5